MSIVGFDVVSRQHEWLQGLLIYFLPEHRGKGLLPPYFDAATDLALKLGLRGFMFWNSIPHWKGEPNNFLVGPTVGGETSYWRPVREGDHRASVERVVEQNRRGRAFLEEMA